MILSKRQKKRRSSVQNYWRLGGAKRTRVIASSQATSLANKWQILPNLPIISEDVKLSWD
jgi:hypothetical protein